MSMRIIYENPLEEAGDIDGFILEGKAGIDFSDGYLRMENVLSSAEGQRANYVLWCPVEFPDHIRISWEFKPIREPGLAMLFFAARAQDGGSIFGDALVRRTGEYAQYHHGDINAFHVSWFRRKEPDERAFHTCNLRKSYGFHLVSQGADPIPDASEDADWYRIAVEKSGSDVRFCINDLLIFSFRDDGKSFGPLLSGGCIGFRQLAPMVGGYRRLLVTGTD